MDTVIDLTGLSEREIKLVKELVAILREKNKIPPLTRKKVIRAEDLPVTIRAVVTFQSDELHEDKLLKPLNTRLDFPDGTIHTLIIHEVFEGNKQRKK